VLLVQRRFWRRAVCHQCSDAADLKIGRGLGPGTLYAG
jgi:hypothetical protein